MADDKRAEQDPKTGRFLPGNTGFGGRPKGSRNKLGEEFLEDLHAEWTEHGKSTLKLAREDKPMDFVRMVAGILPRDLLIRTAPEDAMTDDELADTIQALADALADIRADREGISPTHSGTGTA